MNIAELKALIKDLPDNLEVMIPVNGEFGEFEGFISPCTQESQSMPLGADEFDDSFVLVPCGFFDEPIFDEVSPELN